MERTPSACKTVSEIAVGDRVEVDYVVTSDDLRKFAELSGDWNPVHFDEEFAAKSMFRQRIAHGMVSVAKFSGIFGMELPGLGALWESQTVKFMSAVLLDKPYRAIAEARAIDGRRVTFDTWVEDGDGQRVIEGSGVVIPISDGLRKRLSPA
jgi:3-hydroxybutyryl-CoA dehydratase